MGPWGLVCYQLCDLDKFLDPSVSVSFPVKQELLITTSHDYGEEGVQVGKGLAAAHGTEGARARDNRCQDAPPARAGSSAVRLSYLSPHQKPLQPPSPRCSNAVSLEWGPRICLSNESPGDIEAAGPGTTL